MAEAVTMDKVVALCKRRGLIFPASEIYGGIANTYDYGHYGVLLKNNVVNAWWKAMIQERGDIVALDSAIVQHPRTWEASGHLAGFTDPLIDCRTCKQRFRADHLGDSACGRKPSKRAGETPECDLTEAREFNLMFETSIGPVKDAGSTVYLRPETAQGIFLNFKNVLQFARRKPPFGIAQVGKSFRNEITPGNFIFRTLEFEQMEMEFFVPPDEAEQWHQHWLQARMDWYTGLGIRPDHLKLRPHDADELSHYSSATSDVEYLYPIGWSELEGIANRGDFDLTQHARVSGEKLEFFDGQTRERYVPHVIEPAAGVGRSVLAFLCDAYDEDEAGGEQRTLLKLHPALAPVKVGVLPLLRKDGQPEVAREIHSELRRRGLQCEYDEGGSIGKRYRRQDEIGTPYGVTVDHQTLEDRTVTVRDRDTLTQDRVAIDALPDEAGDPALLNAEALERIADPDFTTELAQFNVEINIPPRLLADRVFSDLEQAVRDSLNAAEDQARGVGAHMMLVGILPTISDAHLNGDAFSANPRYKLLNEQIFAARGEDLEIAITGPERLATFADTIAPEAACTSVQLHQQVDPDAFARHWNAAQAIAGVQLALAANSPFFFGRELWRETRIALFEQATDTRPEELKAQGVRPRVWFGERWITSIFDLFEENVTYFPALLPVCEPEDPVEALERGDVPQLAELRLHNGTVYRWNRPVYDVVRGKPHLRVENRVLPAGPSVVDTLANAAFYYGLVRMLLEEERPIWTRMSFSAAEENFHAGARTGSHARVS